MIIYSMQLFGIWLINILSVATVVILYGFKLSYHKNNKMFNKKLLKEPLLVFNIMSCNFPSKEVLLLECIGRSKVLARVYVYHAGWITSLWLGV